MKSIPMLSWTERPGALVAEIGDGCDYRIFPRDPEGFELWLYYPDHRSEHYLGWFVTQEDAQSAAKTHVGDD